VDQTWLLLRQLTVSPQVSSQNWLCCGRRTDLTMSRWLSYLIIQGLVLKLRWWAQFRPLVKLFRRYQAMSLRSTRSYVQYKSVVQCPRVVGIWIIASGWCSARHSHFCRHLIQMVKGKELNIRVDLIMCVLWLGCHIRRFPGISACPRH
jgi:hypothetical protein